MLTAVIKSRCRARISVRVVSTLTMLVATMLVALLLCPEGYTQSQTAQEVQKSFTGWPGRSPVPGSHRT